MPLSTGGPFTQFLIAFAMIGVLGLVLKWTFSRGRDNPAPQFPLADTAATDPASSSDSVNGTATGMDGSGTGTGTGAEPEPGRGLPPTPAPPTPAPAPSVGAASPAPPSGAAPSGGAPSSDAPESPDAPDTPSGRPRGHPSRHRSTRDRPGRDQAASDDFGLLAAVAVVESAAEAQRIRTVLRAAGIRATTTVGRDGRHRVLVFQNELLRARRVGGWSP